SRTRSAPPRECQYSLEAALRGRNCSAAAAFVARQEIFPSAVSPYPPHRRSATASPATADERKVEQLVPCGSLAKLVMRSGRVEVHADHPDQSVQRAPFPGRGDSAVRPLVPPLSPRLRTRRRTLGGTRRGGGSQLYLALGAGLRTRAQPTLPPT